MQPSTHVLKQQFCQLFGQGGKVHVIRAPGRVNLIGEHTDYNDGFVFPMAIEPEVLFICRGRTDGKVRLTSTIFPEQIAEFSVQEKIARGEPKWANYPKGVAAELIGAGIPLTGIDVLISNTLPVGGGLSSSAAIEVGTAVAFLTIAGLKLDLMRLALVCQTAEHEYALVPCGLMDQMIVATAREGQATLFDCRSMEKQFIPIDPKELRVIIVNSMVKHELSGGEYAQRRKQCETGVAYFKKHNPDVKALRDVTLKQVLSAEKDLDPVVFKRCRHVVSENQRTTEAAAALGSKNYERAGELMMQSHSSLRDDYEVSCVELDFLVEQASKIKGIYGARMTGGGFGGCIVAIAQPNAVDHFKSEIIKAYQAKFKLEPTVFVTTATAGTSVIE